MPQVKLLDKYIFKKFILTFFMAIILIVGIVIIFDISEKIDDFVAKNAPLKAVVFDYYVNFVPYFMNMFSPLFVFISVIFFTSIMASNSEIIAILSCGVSYKRMLMPYMAAAAVIALFSLALSLYIIPNGNEKRVAFEARYTKANRRALATKNVHYQIDPGKFVYVESFSSWNNTAYNFTLEEVKDNRIVSKLSAESAKWDSTLAGWRLKNWFIRDYSEGLEDKVRSGEKMDTVLSLTVTDFYRNKNTVEGLPIRKLNQLIRTQKMRGDANVMYSQLEKHQRYSMPFSAFILTIIGVTLSSRKKRGGIGWNIGIGIALSFTYILFMRFSQMFVYTGDMPAVVALWIPNVLYAIVAAVLYHYAQK